MSRVRNRRALRLASAGWCAVALWAALRPPFSAPVTSSSPPIKTRPINQHVIFINISLRRRTYSRRATFPFLIGRDRCDLIGAPGRALADNTAAA